MPISKDEWDSGRTGETLESRIMTFLRKNRNKGFTGVEIFSGLGYRTTSDFWGFIGLYISLEILVKEGTIKAKIVKKPIGEETYYMTA